MTIVRNESVWNTVRNLFIASAVLFLVNIGLGFDNTLTTGALPRWQSLTHLHAGTLGWITLSLIGLAIWVMSGNRQLDAAYASRVRWLSWLGIVAFGGYIIAFALSFSRGRPFFYFMPVFGIASSLTIWLAAAFSWRQLRRQEIITNAHVFLATALLVLAIGSTIGVLLGLEYIVGFFVPGSDRIGTHAGVMDSAMLLAAAAVISWYLPGTTPQRWTRSGVVVALCWAIAPILAVSGLALDATPLLMASTPLLLLGLLIFIVAIGRHAFRLNPLKSTPGRWIFFGNLWTPLWALLFVYLISQIATGIPIQSLPGWITVVFAHALFVGVMTNLLLGVYSVRSRTVSATAPWAETGAVWLINLGLVVFFALRIASGSRLGALIMGVGVLLGVSIMLIRLIQLRNVESMVTAAAQD